MYWFCFLTITHYSFLTCVSLKCESAATFKIKCFTEEPSTEVALYVTSARWHTYHHIVSSFKGAFPLQRQPLLCYPLKRCLQAPGIIANFSLEVHWVMVKIILGSMIEAVKKVTYKRYFKSQEGNKRWQARSGKMLRHKVLWCSHWLWARLIWFF